VQSVAPIKNNYSFQPVVPFSPLPIPQGLRPNIYGVPASGVEVSSMPSVLSNGAQLMENKNVTQPNFNATFGKVPVINPGGNRE
jgi:hypothetical protein